ncbi:MAG: DUF4382 domain-containing protein [Candidatus Bathyarchaeota archaeon]|nr:MAG: DUF4382 domain-containing protein [Candidatus Bathyarchaeota archaeon]
MTNNGKKTMLYATGGVLIAFLIIASLAISSLTIPGLEFPWFTTSSPPVASAGTLAVLLIDSPVNLTHLNVTLDSISAHRPGYDNETWVSLAFVGNATEVYFDLLALRDVAMNLSITEIPPGNYTMIKMHIKSANATYADGNTTDLDVPSEHIKVIIRFEIAEGETTTILIDMQADSVAVSHSKKLKPVLKAIVLP